MSTERDRFRAAIVRGNTVINPIFDDLAVAVRIAVERAAVTSGARKVIPAAAHAQIMRDVDAALDVHFPRRRGARSLFEAAIVNQCERTEQAEATAAWADLSIGAPDVAAAITTRSKPNG